ncbi:unnamed protein product [Ectocarpus sp. 4 AP-2014]|uniref:EsV-1-6 n=1 Tax=Ectocarpus siliculosus virus 1 (isolate New Zealand/Kaikoura/1988) TaxID=654926 RepID=Q8QNQ3_ESV1K|nr:EsV-1-6 [Ectocarpus siliculosus virus 1]AAK14432.1 EsV-1-6 [Ectocarpus siliculosus virus 1]
MNNDIDYCAYGCPAGKRCPPAASDSCAIGTPRLQNQGTPLCCEVEDDAVYLRTVRAIHQAPSHYNDAEVVAFKQRLGVMLAFLDIPNQGGGSLYDGIVTLNLVINGNTPACTLQRATDLMRLMVRVRRVSLVELCAEIFVGLPPELRNNDKIIYHVHAAEYYRDQALPSLSHGNYTFWYDTPVSAFQFFSLVLRTLDRQTGLVQRRSQISLVCNWNNDGSRIRRRQMNLILRHVRTSTFLGKIIASKPIVGNTPLFEADIPLQTTTVAEGRTVTSSVDTLTIEII